MYILQYDFYNQYGFYEYVFYIHSLFYSNLVDGDIYCDDDYDC